MNDRKKLLKALKQMVTFSSPGATAESCLQESNFFFEGKFMASNVRVTVPSMGLLPFPLDADCIKQLIEMSEKAMFGKGDKTILDTTIRDTQRISAKKFNVEIDEESMDHVLNQIREDMHLGEDCTLIPHLYNMLVYGPGQFFKEHQDTEKVPNMIATLILVLPSPHRGGDLVIRHNSKRHSFFGSIYSGVIKCIAFYSDCYHEVTEIEEGYRVSLTYNIELQTPKIMKPAVIDLNLQLAVVNYFKPPVGFEKSGCDKLVYLLDHEYSERNLRWSMMKGTDRTLAHALYAVAKKEGYAPCLALANYHKILEEEGLDPQEEMTLYFWVDENDSTFQYEIESYDEETCFFAKTDDLFPPFKKKRGDGNQGNWYEGDEFWYMRACVVLWPSAWHYPYGYEKELKSLHQLITQPGKQEDLKEKINANMNNLFEIEPWETPGCVSMLLGVIVYLNDVEVALKILTKLPPKEVLNLENKHFIAWIVTALDLDSWKFLIDKWKKPSNTWDAFLNGLIPFVEIYASSQSVKNILLSELLFQEVTSGVFLMEQDNVVRTNYVENLGSLIQIFTNLGKEDLELNKFIDQISSTMDKVILNVENFRKLKEHLRPDVFQRILLSGLFDKVIESTVSRHCCCYEPLNIYSEPIQSALQEIYFILQTCAEVDVSERKMFAHIMMTTPYTVMFLCDLIIKLGSCAPPEQLKRYSYIQDEIVKYIDGHVNKLDELTDWSLPLKVACSCHNCLRVNRFLVSRKDRVLKIPTVSKKIQRHLDKKVLICSADFGMELGGVWEGKPSLWTLEKTPSLIIKKKELVQRLLLAKKTVLQWTESSDSPPPSKMLKME